MNARPPPASRHPPARDDMPRSCLLVLALFVAAPARAQDSVDFQRDIRPILSNRCFKCHGPAAEEGGLRLDLRERATKRKVIVPGRPEASKLVQRLLSTDEDERMPPPEAGDRLKPEQVALLKQWIARGAEYTPHWALPRRD